MNTQQFLYDIFSQPFVLLVAATIIGHIFIIKKLIPEKAIDLKLEVIKNIIEIKNLLKKIKIPNDIFVRLIKEAGGIPNLQIKIKVDTRLSDRLKAALEGLGKIDSMANYDLPEASEFLDNQIKIYFMEDANVINKYGIYLYELSNLITRFQKLPINPERYQKEWCEFREFDYSNLEITEKELICAIRKGKLIHKKFSS